MNIKILLMVACIMTAAGAKAQKGVDNGTPFGSGQDSVDCVVNTTLFFPYAHSGNYKDALGPWQKVYDDCPGSTKDIYLHGVNIINWQISQETDPAQKDALIDKLMQLYDKRIKYFGDDKRYGKDWIIARKAQSYNTLKGDNTDYSLIYAWTKEVVDEFQEKVDPQAISFYMFASFKIMLGDKDKYKEQYVNDYLKCSALLETALTNATTANNTKDVEGITARKIEIEQNFVTSGAADCETLASIYDPKIEANKDNIEFLKETMILLRRVNCKETETFFTASEYAHKIEPTAESAMGLGGKAFKAENYPEAEKYFLEAIELTEDKDIKADLYYAIAAISLQQSQYIKTKQLSLKCLGEQPNYGKAYMLIAHAYSAGGRGIFDDPVLAKTVYIAAVDKAERARQVDPSVADEAAKFINSLRTYFPKKEEVFMHPELNMGASFKVGGWINETVKIRE
jgi:hypothetical protein